MNSELDVIIARARINAARGAETVPSIDPLPAFTKTHRVFVWTIMYLAEKPQVIEALRREYADVSSEGNRCMHRIIDFLEGNEQGHASTSYLYNSSTTMQAHWDICLEYLRETLKNWLDKGRLC